MTNLATRGLWLTCGLLLSVIIGITGGVLAHIGGDNPARAIIAGASAFAGATTLTVLILNFISPAAPTRTSETRPGGSPG
jgi:hypothetical protein